MIKSVALPYVKRRLRECLGAGSNDGDSNLEPSSPYQDYCYCHHHLDDSLADVATTIATEREGTMPIDIDIDPDSGCEMVKAGKDAKDHVLLLPGMAMEACIIEM
jgi:hypothetical protein